MVANSQQSSASLSSSSSQSATNANLNGGLGVMSANSSNTSSNSNPNLTFQSSSNNNTSTGGLIGGNSSNPNDAAVVNKQRTGQSGSGCGISDLIGQLSDDFRETLLTEKWGASVSYFLSPLFILFSFFITR